MRYRLTARLPVPIDRAFSFSVDPRNTASIHGAGMTVRKLSEGDIGLGAVFHYDRPGKPGWMVAEVTEYDPPVAFATMAKIGDAVPQSGRMTFVEVDGVTQVATETDFNLWPWLPALVLRVFTPICLALIWPMLWMATRAGERLARRALLGSVDGSKPTPPAAPAGSADRLGRTPAQVVCEYLAAREEWELSTMERVHGWVRGTEFQPPPIPTDGEDSAAHLEPDVVAQDVAWSALQTLRERFCTSRVVGLLNPRAPYGTSSEFNPNGFIVLLLEQTGEGDIRLRTQEYPYPQEGLEPLPQAYEYRLRLVEGEWRLDSRDAWYPDGKAIRNLL